MLLGSVEVYYQSDRPPSDDRRDCSKHRTKYAHVALDVLRARRYYKGLSKETKCRADPENMVRHNWIANWIRIAKTSTVALEYFV